MDAIMLENGRVRFMIDNEWLAQYGIDVDHLEARKPYSWDIYEALLTYGEKKFQVSFDHEFVTYRLFRTGADTIEMDIKPKAG